MKHTVLITGCSGFVGTNLVDAWRQDFQLYGLDIIVSYGSMPPADIFTWDSLNELPPFDTIIHLAGKAHDTANTQHLQEYFDVNLGLTKRIFDHFMASDSKTFIFFSSVKAVADTVDGEPLTEYQTPDPQTPYGKSKLAAEQYIIKTIYGNHDSSALLNTVDFSESPGYKQSGKRVFILRPAMIHGPGNKGNLNLLYRVVQKGLPWPLGAFSNLRSFASIDNVAYVLREVIEKPVAPGIYNIADDEPLSTNRLISLMAESLKSKTRVWKVSPGIIKILARTGDILHLPLNNERLKKLTECYVVSNNRIKKAIGIKHLPVDALTGLKKTLATFQ